MLLLLLLLFANSLYRWSCRISWDISVRLCRSRCPARPSATGLRLPRQCPSKAPARHGLRTPCAVPSPSTRRWRTSCNICRPSSTPFATCPWARRPVWRRSLRPPVHRKIRLLYYDIMYIGTCGYLQQQRGNSDPSPWVGIIL